MTTRGLIEKSVQDRDARGLRMAIQNARELNIGTSIDFYEFSCCILHPCAFFSAESELVSAEAALRTMQAEEELRRALRLAVVQMDRAALEVLRHSRLQYVPTLTMICV